MKYLNTILTRGLNLIKSWLRPGFVLLSILFTIGVTNAWGKTYSAGDVLFYDFSAVTGGGGTNWHTGTDMMYDASGAGSVKCVIFTSSVTISTTWVVAKTAKGGWAEMKFTEPASGKNCIKVNADGKTFSWTTRSLAEDVASGNYIMVYGGELSSWNQASYRFMSANNTDNSKAVANANLSITINSEAYKFGPVSLPSGTYYQGHWASGLSCAIAAGCAYVVRGSTTNTTYYEQKAKSGDNYIYRVKKQGATSPTTSLSPTCPSSIDRGSKLSFSHGAAGVSVLGRTNSVKYYLKNGSTYTEKTLSDGKIDVSDLAEGDYSIITLLYDGYIYVKASTSNFSVVTPASYSLTVEAGAHISTVTGSTDPITLGNSYSISASGFDTGYEFNNWTADPAGNASFASSTSASTSVTVSNGSVTVTANAKEKKHTVNIYYKCGSTTIKTTTTASVGEITTSSVSAPAISGYSFSSWTAGSGVTTTTSTSSSPVSIKTKSSGTYSLTANYNEVLTTTWTLRGSFVDDFATAYAFMKRTGESTGNVAYATVTLSANTTYRFKVVNNGSTWYGNDNSEGGGTYYIKGTTENWTFETSKGDCYMTTTLAGTYTFKINFSGSNPVVSVYYPEVYAISGDFNSWTETSNMVFDGNVGTAVINLTARAAVYEFKVLENGVWCGGSHAITGTTSNLDVTVGGGANMTIKADIYPSGNYTFSYNKSTHKLSVTYPTSYQISFDRVPTEGGKTAPWGNFTGVLADKQITSGVTKIANGATAHFYAANAADGYTYYGWYKVSDAPKGTYTNRVSSSQEYAPTVSSSTPTNLYAKYYPNDYTVTLDKQTSAPGYGGGGSCTNQTVTYHTALSAISGTMPTGTGYYGFDGFYSATGGAGTKVINADGTWVRGATGFTTSDNKWDSVGNVTLYAYYKQTAITDVTLSPAAVEWKESGDNFVKANPTIYPTPAGAVNICWKLLYDNGDEITGHDAVADTEGGTKPDQVKFNLAGLAAGNYTIRAILSTGSTPCSGTELNTFDKTVTVTNKFTVTILYKCGDATIRSSEEKEGKPITATSITAPSITGYTFHHWVLGDGITCTSGTVGDATHTGTATISYTAIFDGSLTAVYTRKRMIYFYNTLGWSTVNVYFYKNSSYWEDTGEKRGSGAKTTSTWTDTPYGEGKHGTMTRIDGTNIYYFDAEAAGVPAAYQDVVFTEANQHGYEFFYETKAARRGDYKSSLPMFVPIDKKTETRNKTDYYSYGYWMNYPENTGYTLKIYGDPMADNVTGAVREYPFPFSEDSKMPWKTEVEFNFTGQIWFMIYRNDGQLLGKSYTMKQDYHETDLDSGSDQKIEIKTSAPGVYKFTLSFRNTGTEVSPNYKYNINVEYPVSIGDYRIKYTDLATWSNGAHTASWWHASDIIRLNTGSSTKADTVSLYVAYGSSPSAKFQKVTAIDNNTGKVTWADVASGTVSLAGITEKGVYNFIVSQPAGGASISLTKTEKYTGNFYIRTDNAGSTKWDNYRAFDHQMTYSEFSFSDANTTDVTKKYSHYFASWCERGTNIQFCVANDYSACISDTLMQDVGNPYKNTDEYGTLKTDGASLPINDRYSSNVRFMYNYSTNKISRAYVASATNPSRLFLVLRAESEIQDESREPYEAQDINNAVILMDKENWIYEEILYIMPGTKFKLFASYALKDPYRMDSVQYFRGAYATGDNKTTCTFNASNSVVLISGSGSWQKARVIYDFKTNRLIAAWIPDGTAIDDPHAINADVLIEREHQKPAEYVVFEDDGKLTEVKTIYGAMKFNRWILNNRSNPNDIDPTHAKTTEQLSTYHPPLAVGQQKSIYERSLYFISFPFDVRVSEIFGFGHYWDEWYLEYYDGLNRAKNGYWIDSPPNWKYVEPEMADTMVLRKNVGYILGLDLDYMQADNFNFWSNGISTVELFFPSTTTAGSIKEISEVVIPSLPSTYKCTINRTGIDGDRRVKDSYWRCIGVPSFNLYNSAVKDASGNTIGWKTDYTWHSDESEFPFIYRWNMSDNTITPQSTSAFAFQPMHSYLVQNGGEIHWTNVSGPSAIVARRARKEDYTEYNWRLALMSDTTLIDQTYIRMSELEQITDSFDFGQDMSKEFNAYRSDLYTRIGYERLAANSMPLNTETTTIVPVGIKVYKAGEFTLSMPDGTYGVSITLVDNLTGARTELGAGFTYSFESEAGQFDERFHLEIAKIQSVATGTEEIGESSKSDVRKVIINGILYIVRGNRIYDARGTRIE